LRFRVAWLYPEQLERLQRLRPGGFGLFDPGLRQFDGGLRLFESAVGVDDLFLGDGVMREEVSRAVVIGLRFDDSAALACVTADSDCRQAVVAAFASGLSSMSSGWPAATLSPSLTSTRVTRPATGNGTRDMRFGLTSTLPGAVTSPAGIASSFIGSTRICASLGESGGIMITPGVAGAIAKGASRSRFRSALPPQPAPASAQANTNKKLIGVVRMMIRKFPDQCREQ
jgi:hypothetical protein